MGAQQSAAHLAFCWLYLISRMHLELAELFKSVDFSSADSRALILSLEFAVSICPVSNFSTLIKYYSLP